MLFLLMFGCVLARANAQLDMSRFTQGKHVVRSYTAKMKINGDAVSYEHFTVHREKPQPLEYAESDSCFYLTFEISDLSQTSGVPCTANFFLILPERPAGGDSFSLRAIPESEDESNPIVGWDRSLGPLAAVQICTVPRCREVFHPDSVPEGRSRDRIILSDISIDSGELRIEEIEPRSKGDEDLYIKLTFSINATMAGGEDKRYRFPLAIADGKAELFYVKKEEMMPLLFPIDYNWGHIYIPDRDRKRREIKSVRNSKTQKKRP